MAKDHATTREDHARRAVDDIQGATLVPDPSAPLTWQVYRERTDRLRGYIADHGPDGWLSCRVDGTGSVLCVSCLNAVRRLCPNATHAYYSNSLIE